MNNSMRKPVFFNHDLVRHDQSIHGRRVDDHSQPDLFHGDSVTPGQLPLSVVLAQPTPLACINLAFSLSGVSDAQMARHLKVDTAVWSRVKGGDANFPTNMRVPFMKKARAIYPLQWEAYHLGFDLVPHKTALEERAERAEARAAAAEERARRAEERNTDLLALTGRK